MQQAKDLVVGALAGKGVVYAAVPAPVPVKVDPQTAEVVNKLFVELQAIYPAWRQAWPDDKALGAAKRSWTKALMAAGLSTLEEIRFGLQQCRAADSDFVPSVGKFIKWCMPSPEALGLPSVEAAFLQACRLAHPMADRSKAHPAVYDAACAVGLRDLLNLPAEKTRKRFEDKYLATVKRVVHGEPLRAVPVADLPAPSQRTPEVGRAALANLRKAVGGGL